MDTKNSFNMNKMFTDGLYENEWYENLIDFYGWLNSEQRKCEPRGVSGQSMSITSGYNGLLNKYPTFEDAYNAYATYVNDTKKGE